MISKFQFVYDLSIFNLGMCSGLALVNMECNRWNLASIMWVGAIISAGTATFWKKRLNSEKGN